MNNDRKTGGHLLVIRCFGDFATDEVGCRYIVMNVSDVSGSRRTMYDFVAGFSLLR